MTDLKWLRTNVEKQIKSIERRPNISAEQQGLLNILYCTSGLIDEVEYILGQVYESFD